MGRSKLHGVITQNAGPTISDTRWVLFLCSLRLRMEGHNRLDWQPFSCTTCHHFVSVQERCIDKQQTVACCHNITSRQPVYCSRLQQVSCLVSLVLFVKSPALKNGYSLRIFTNRVLRIYRESTRSETRGKNR
jgi:hypothetical protein